MGRRNDELLTAIYIRKSLAAILQCRYFIADASLRGDYYSDLEIEFCGDSCDQIPEGRISRWESIVSYVLRILTVFDCGRGVSKERESVYAVWNVPAE